MITLTQRILITYYDTNHSKDDNNIDIYFMLIIMVV